METIDEIVRVMRESGKRSKGYMEMTLCRFADRIEAAAKELTEENARLRAELAKARNCAPEYIRPDFPWEY